ncbi:dTDP-4-dehydrorhamnose 3,5-epimerase [Paenibacillus koleovorans]|uniref:dTDP-4-dehydrorhamnose 3,5-epimerase n=1 Tax=Paenibacillus koleovorans TaxID=121608 RepID=UPI000FDC486C|nr:dTDP-4-dehydrorhamnose 3,5-epimerase [Paenibacillus koleovorans]
MKLTETKLSGLVLLEPEVHGDHRGYFMESYNANRLEALGITYSFVQDNQSLSVMPGVIRGLHFQLNPKAQTKLVRVLSGVIYDVAVDIRKNSPTFGQWAGFILSEHNKRQLLVPQGMAHGFCTLTPNTQVLYKVDQIYSAEHDRGLLWSDPELGIDWPVSRPILSEKDMVQPKLRELDTNF